jgi:hypothetical protein
MIKRADQARKGGRMLKATLALIVLIFLFSPTFAQNAGVENLRDVHNIYVDDFGQTDNVKLFRQELIDRLFESNRIKVVGSPDEADAVLSINITQSSKNDDRIWGETMRVGTSVTPVLKLLFQLMNHQDRAIWALKLTSESYSTMNEKAARELAKKVSRELLKAIEKKDKG